MNELVSVIVPVFNVRDYVGKCIESILRQNYTNIEIIIVDDGSTDGSEKICKQFADKDSRIIYLYQANQGLVGARKTGLIHAKGKYIVFVDGDDYVESDYVEKLYGLMIENDVDIVHSNYMVNGENQKHTKQVHLYQEKDLDLEFRAALLRNHVFEWEAEKEIFECNIYGCIYKKNVIYECYMDLPDSQQYGEDLLCLCNLIMKCQSMMFIPDAFYHYVKREGSLCHPGDFMVALSNEVSLYEEVERTLRKYKIVSALSDKCRMFFIRRIFEYSKLIGIIIKLENTCAHHKIYLYGAGMYGRTLFAFMQEQNIGHIEKFIVSEPDAKKIVFGAGVITLEEYVSQRTHNGEPEEEDVIIVAVSEKYSTEIVRQLEDRRLYNYMTLAQKEWGEIYNATLFDCITPQKNIAVLMYHRIIDSDYRFWKLNVSPQVFERHIKYISENYNVLKLDDEWCDIVKPDQKYVVITFDDGYVDNYRFALPILEKYHVPATIFVSTGLIDTDEMYWWDELEKIFIIDGYTGEFEFDGVSYRVIDANDRKNVCFAIRNHIKDMEPAERKDSLRRLRSMFGLEQPGTSDLRCVNTQELVKMAESPYVTIGGHTKTHLSLGSTHPKELLREEIEESLDILQKKINKRIDVFAYPFGGAEDRCDMAEQILVDCGIRKSVVVRSGNVNADDEMYNIPRHMVYETDDIEKKLNKIWGMYG